MNQAARELTRTAVRGTALALAIPLLLLAASAGAQFANDGARQNAEGGWDMPYDECTMDGVYGATYTNETDCEAADATWLKGVCRLNRYQCQRVFLSRDGAVDPLYDTSGECGDAGHQWLAGACSTGEDFRGADQPGQCVAAHGVWYTNVCRGRSFWDASYGFPSSSGAANYRDECTRCHNALHYPAGEHGGERGNGDHYVMTGHKNMLRPVAPVGNTDPHFTTGAPWAGSSGEVYATDSSGNPIDFSTGTITVGGVTKTLYFLYGGWVAETPRSIAAGGSYTCARCHTTGWSADATMNLAKEPAKMFGDYTGLFSTAADGGAYTSWDVYGISCARCHGSRVALETPDVRHHPNIVGKEATGGSATGATRVALCMDCHRQETGGQPYPGQDTDPGGVLKVGPSHESVEFVSHPTGNQFLNSPHGNFSGTFAQINDKIFYDTHFKNEGESWPYQGNAGGCTQCHDVHKSTVHAANPDGGAIHEECTACHTKDVSAIAHPTGLGTPIESKAYPNEACVACHMPGGLHLFRINVEETYSTFPAAALAGTANANTAPAGDDANAVWVDLDAACGQCHGGGSNQAFATGSMTSGLKVLTVDDATGFAAGERIEIEGAGAGGSLLHTYIVSVAGNDLTLAGKAGVTVSGAEVVQNAVKNNGAYFTKSELAQYAVGIHRDKPNVYFGYKLASPDTLTVMVDASASTCTGSAANCNAYSWSWGDGTPNGSGVTASHTYASAGTYAVTLTVTQYSIGSASRTQNVTVYTPDLPPVVSGDCTLDANTWVATVTDTSTDAGGVAQVVVNWGDNSVVSNDTFAPFGPFTHSYLQPGTFTVKKKVVDTIGQQTTVTACVLTPSYFTLTGNVRRLNDAPVPMAAVTVKKGLLTVRTVYTDVAGNYTVGNLKPGTYTLTAKKTGLTFAQVYTVTVGPSSGGYNFQSAQ